MLEKLRNTIYNLLRWSEKYTRTDMVYLAKGGGWMMLGRIVAMLAAFGLSIAFANLLPKEVFGDYKYVISVVGILALSTLSGMSTAQARASARGHDGDLKSGIRAEMKWGLLGSLTSLALCILYFSRHDFVLASSFGVVALFMPFFNVFSLYAGVLQGKRLFGRMVQYDIWTQCANFCLVLPALFLTHQVWLLMIPYLFLNSGFQYLLYKRAIHKVSLTNTREVGTVKYGKVLSLVAFINTLADSMDQILTFIFLGPIQLAVYNMALAPTEQIKSIFKMIMPLAFPKFAVQDKETFRKNVLVKTLKFTLIIVFFVAVYIVLAPWLYALFFPQYTESVFYSRLLAISLLGLSSYLPNTALQAQKAESFYLNMSVIASLFQILAIGVGLYWFGLLGIILARILTRFFNFVVTMHYVRKVSDLT